MTTKDWIQLFFSRMYEKQINDMILEDRYYDIPRESLLNYVNNLIKIPYSEFIEYLSSTHTNVSISTEDLPYFESFKFCEEVLVNYLLEAENPGILLEEYGIYCKEKGVCDYSSDKIAGRRHLKTAEMLGLVYEYYNHWYLNCLGYIYEDLSSEDSDSLVARTILRNSFFAKVVLKSIDSSRVLHDFLPHKSAAYLERFVDDVNIILDYAVKEASFDNISINRIEGLWKRKVKTQTLKVNYTKKYLREINKFDFLTIEDCYHYGRLRDRGIDRGRDRLITGTLCMAYGYAKRYQGHGVLLDDLIQEANLGLINAAEKYEPQRGFHFASYAQYWVYMYLNKAIVYLPHTVSLPINIANNLWKIKKEQNKLYAINEIEPLKEDFDYPLKEYALEYILKLPDDINEFYTPLESESLECEDNYLADYETGKEDLKLQIASMLSILDYREKDIICYSFGVNNYPVHKLEEIGTHLHLTSERVRQIRKNALKKMRLRFRNRVIEEPAARDNRSKSGEDIWTPICGNTDTNISVPDVDLKPVQQVECDETKKQASDYDVNNIVQKESMFPEKGEHKPEESKIKNDKKKINHTVIHKHHHRWTTGEENVLLTACKSDDTTLEQLADSLNRSKSAILSRLSIYEMAALNKGLNIAAYYAPRMTDVSEEQIMNYVREMMINTRFGIKNPCKYIMLISILELIEEGKIKDVLIEYNADLKDIFITIWDLTLPENIPFEPKIYETFILMAQEPFWTLITKDNINEIPPIKEYYNKKEFEEKFCGAEVNPGMMLAFINKKSLRKSITDSLYNLLKNLHHQKE